MIGSAAARQLNTEYLGCSVHRRGTSCRSMYLDMHVRLKDTVINDANMCQAYLQSLGHELAQLDRDIFDEFTNKCIGEVDKVSPHGRVFGSCPMLLTEQNCPVVFRQVRETMLHALLRNFMCK